jgi:hypothetical protein
MKKIKIGKFVAPVLRGVLKSVPFGGIVVESINNIKTEIENKNTTDVSEAKDLPHNWISITVQILCLIGIVYAFISKQITIEQFLEYLPK